MTSKQKTYFEQVPLDVVKKIAQIDDPKDMPVRRQPDTVKEKKTTEVLAAPLSDGLQVMNSSFDIFQMETDGSVLWQGLASNIEEAKQRVKQLQVQTPAQYMVISLKTGGKLLINSDEPREQQTQTEAS